MIVFLDHAHVGVHGVLVEFDVAIGSDVERPALCKHSDHAAAALEGGHVANSRKYH